MVRILVTGANGFIGRNLAECLADKFEILSPSREELNLLDEDAVYKYIADKKIDIVVHCAMVGGTRDTLDRPNVCYENCRMFFNIVRNADKVKKIIHFGSGAEYDFRFYQPKMSEDYFDKHVPIDDYGFAKYVCSKYILAANKNIIGVRPFSVFGKYEKYHIRFISRSILNNIFGLPIVINQNIFFDYIYINDLVKIIEYLINNDVREKIYNLCTSKTVDLISIANLVNQIGDNKSEIKILKQGVGKEYSGNNSRLLAELGDFSFIPIEQAIRELYNWHKANLDKIDKILFTSSDYLITKPRDNKLVNF